MELSVLEEPSGDRVLTFEYPLFTESSLGTDLAGRFGANGR